jgi:hypothetical protein
VGKTTTQPINKICSTKKLSISVADFILPKSLDNQLLN